MLRQYLKIFSVFHFSRKHNSYSAKKAAIIVPMFMDPMQTLRACDIHPSETVADFGAGAGFMARAAATLVPQGQVFAIEINRDMVARVTREVVQHHIQNLHVLWGDIEVPKGCQLENASVDFLILSNIMFQLEDKQGCIQEVLRVLKPHGRVLLVDWSESFGGMGPAPTSVFSKPDAQVLFARLGLTELPAMVPAGAHHYGILFKR